MILVDTSVWIDHFRSPNSELTRQLRSGKVLSHPFVLGEIALGYIPDREETLRYMSCLPQVKTASNAEAWDLIERNRLWGSGVGLVDVHLLAAARLATGTTFWTIDKRLAAVAERLSLTEHRLH